MPNYKEQKNRGKKPQNSLWLFIIGAFLIIVFVTGFGLPKVFKNIASSVSLPIFNLERTFVSAFSNLFPAFAFKKDLMEVNAALKQKLVLLQDVEAQMRLVQDENDALKGVVGENDGKNFVASVILKPPQALYDTLLLSSGEKSGIKMGDFLYATDTIILGKIVEVESNTSLGKLFTSSGEKTEAFLGAKAIPAELTGVGGGAFTAQLPKGVEVAEGDPAYLQIGTERKLVGVVRSIETTSNNSFETLHVGSPVNIFELQAILIK